MRIELPVRRTTAIVLRGLSVLAVALAPALLNAAQGPLIRKDLRFQTKPHSVLVLTNDDGAITIRGVAVRQVQVIASAHSSKTEIDSSQNGDRIEITTHHLQNTTGEERQVDYEMSVPSDMILTIKAQSGTIRITNVSGNLEVDAETASIELRDLEKTHANLRSMNGPISINNARDVTLAVTCSSGKVNLNSVTGPVVSVSTSSGPITYTGLINQAGEYNLISHSGDILLIMSPEASIDLMARSIRGTVENEFPLQQKPHLAFAPIQGRSFAGTSNSGVSSVQLETFSGKIRVKKQ